MSEAAERHAAFAARLREAVAAEEQVLDAFARVPRHPFLPGIALEVAYTDDAVVTHDEGGIPTSSSSQPSLMARMIQMLDVQPGARVLEIGAGTGYNAALLAALGAAVTTVELQPGVAAAAAVHLREAGLDAADDGAPGVPGTVRVVTGDGAAPPDGPYDRVIVTAGCWALPPRLVGALADGGLLVAPLRVNGVELAVALRRDGDTLHAAGGLPCGFMPLRGDDERPWRWPLGAGGSATADADLGDEGRGALDRLLATPGRPVENPLGLRDGEQALDALLWLALRGDPLISLARPAGGGSPAWTVALDVLPASLLVIAPGPSFGTVSDAVLHGGEGALRACDAAMAAWRAAGAPGPGTLELTVEPSGDRTGWSLPFPTADGAATMTRGAHRWTLRYAPPSAFSPQNAA
jgi:protein-L-isoaspartate(D-aspartate) O-methyltransferase